MWCLREKAIPTAAKTGVLYRCYTLPERGKEQIDMSCKRQEAKKTASFVPTTLTSEVCQRAEVLLTWVSGTIDVKICVQMTTSKAHKTVHLGPLAVPKVPKVCKESLVGFCMFL